MPIPSLDPSLTSAVAPMPGARRAPSAQLFTPLRPKTSLLGGPSESDDDSGPHPERLVFAQSETRPSVPDTPVTAIHSAGSPVAATPGATTPSAKPAAAQLPQGSMPSFQTPEASLPFQGRSPWDSPRLNEPSPSTTPPPPPMLVSGRHCASSASAKGKDEAISVHLSDLPAAPTANAYAQWGTWGKRFSEDLTLPQSLRQATVSVQKTRLYQPPGSSVGKAGPWEALSNLHGSPAFPFHFESPKAPAVVMTPRNKVPRPTCT